MRDFSTDNGIEDALLPEGVSAAGALRSVILEKITPILVECNVIDDSSRRLLIQACCLDVVTAMEDVICAFGLEDQGRMSMRL